MMSPSDHMPNSHQATPRSYGGLLVVVLIAVLSLGGLHVLEEDLVVDEAGEGATSCGSIRIISNSVITWARDWIVGSREYGDKSRGRMLSTSEGVSAGGDVSMDGVAQSFEKGKRLRGPESTN
jgi:hypothetical protein